MTREEAKRFLPLIKAYAEGKTIQILKISTCTLNKTWSDLKEPSFIGNPIIYRIKPEEVEKIDVMVNGNHYFISKDDFDYLQKYNNK